jgi:hypothetical protein
MLYISCISSSPKHLVYIRTSSSLPARGSLPPAHTAIPIPRGDESIPNGHTPPLSCRLPSTYRRSVVPSEVAAM